MSEKSSQRARRRSKSRSLQPKEAAPTRAQADTSIRLNRYIAQAGICSRRKADTLISEGRVRLNGAVVTELGTKVNPGDVVEVGGRTISPQQFDYLLLNKPDDTITTTSDDRGRRTVMDLLSLPEAEKKGIFPVGRLDRNSTGVLLLTNDGDLANRLMHPRYEVDKIYQVRTRRPVKPHELDQLRAGVDIGDGPVAADQAAYVEGDKHHEIALLLHEGRNRQVRRMMEALGHEVVRLERIHYAGLTTEGVRRGKWRRLAPHEVKRLRRLVNLK